MITLSTFPSMALQSSALMHKLSTPSLLSATLRVKNLSKVKQILACLTYFLSLPQASPCWGQHRALAWSVWPSMLGPLQGPLFHLYIKCKVGWGTWLGNLARFTCQVNQKVVRLKVKVFFAEFCHRFLVIAVGGVRVHNALYFYALLSLTV